VQRPSNPFLVKTDAPPVFMKQIIRSKDFQQGRILKLTYDPASKALQQLRQLISVARRLRTNSTVGYLFKLILSSSLDKGTPLIRTVGYFMSRRS
jgi:hypothetical protein